MCQISKKAFRVDKIGIKRNIGKFSMKIGECIYNVSMNFSEVVLVNVYSIFLNEKQYLQSCKWSGVKIMHKVFKSPPQSFQNWTICESNLHRGFRNQVQHLQIISEDLYAKKVVRLVGIKRSQISVKIDYYCFYSVPPTGGRSDGQHPSQFVPDTFVNLSQRKYWKSTIVTLHKELTIVKA